MKFSEEVRALMGQYNDNIRLLKKESTEEIFSTAFNKPTWQIRPTNINKLRKYCFYIINYDYNGNKIWSPILSLDYKVKDNKNILFAINFDYLPYKYKILFIDNLLDANKSVVNSNRDIQNVLEEGSLKSSMKGIYNWLKSNSRKEYSLTAFDVLKIKQVYAVSTSILDRFIFLDTRYVNKRTMLDTMENQDDKEKKEEMKKKIEKYEEILEMYESDIEAYYKSLRNFEANLKLFED